jgi:addiction module HigA family antidote
MKSQSETPFREHPGSFVKRVVIPADVTVKEAAARMKVGRPALSNFLNGKSALSAEMAVRLEKTFSADREYLMSLQAAYDQRSLQADARALAVRSYAPSLFDITARQIQAWADKNIEARRLLPVLLRRLIRSTGSNLSLLDFPAYDNAERHGWDGQVKTDTVTPWIPEGASGWEFGCDQDPRAKAQKDYMARVAGTPKQERDDTIFVFVTPRNWPAKHDWAKERQAEKNWKGVRVLDASDFEQWLEQSVSAQGWMAEQIGVDTKGIVSLDHCWNAWATVTEPEIDKSLFAGSVKAYRSKIEDFLTSVPDKPLVITADSKEEALAFLACVFEEAGEPSGADYDRVVVLETVEALANARRVSSNFIAVVTDPKVEAALAGLQKSQPTIIFRSYVRDDEEPKIALDLLDYETFKSALHKMGIDEDRISQLERASGKSPTILRRQLSTIPEIRMPKWAQDKVTARKVIPLGLIGVWNADVGADQERVSFLAGEKYDAIEQLISTLSTEEQAPAWSIGQCRGVASRIDVLYATSGLFTRKDIEGFFAVAQQVLCEHDPALELSPDKRWAAQIYGKAREHSSVLRDSICETLVLLAVHGNNLFQAKMQFDVEARVDKLIRDLLTPLDAKTWASQQDDLPRYAEAAPAVFLDILRQDLASDNPQVLELLRPVDSGILGNCARSGLLWALELLAWNPDRLLEVALLLAALSEQKIDDNWQNKPENSLLAIFRAWMPQTSASLEQRTTVMERIVKRHPDVGWRLCFDQFKGGSRVGHYSSRPRWRNDALGAGQPLRYRHEVYPFMRKALDIALAWPKHNENTLGDLIEEMQDFEKKDHDAIWRLVVTWAASTADEIARARLRERVRKFAFTRRGLKITNNKTKTGAKKAYKLLEPRDIVVKHQWLFAEHWVEESLEEIEDADYDYTKREERIRKQRDAALSEIWKNCGADGIVRLCLGGNAAYVVGSQAADIVGIENAEEFLFRLICEGHSQPKVEILNCVAGFLGRIADERRDNLIGHLLARFEPLKGDGEDHVVSLLRCAPFVQRTWQHLADLPKKLTERYWREVSPQWARQSPEELRNAIDQLVKFNRPRAALRLIHMDYKDIDTPRLVRLLKEVATNVAEPTGHYRLQGYEISDMLKLLDGRTDASRDELAHLEFLYLEALDNDKHGIPNLQRQLAESPSLFMQALGLCYKRRGPGEDPPEWNVEDKSGIATQAYRLLHAAKRIPGTREDGSIDADKLMGWIREVRTLCKVHGRESVGDQTIGDLLAKAPADADGLWPCQAVREALEEIAAPEIAKGMAIGVYNLRGAHWRGEGGQQERELAAKYRGWSKQTAFEYPFVSGFLEQIAKSYDRDAERQDIQADVSRRL